MSDKVRELAEKCIDAVEEFHACGAISANVFERIIRAELKALLEAARDLHAEIELHQRYEREHTHVDMDSCRCAGVLKHLAAELQHWHSMERTPER